MRMTAFLLGAAAVSLQLHAAATAATSPSDPSGLWKEFPAIYKLHSGSVADRMAPTATDRKLTVHVKGEVAKEMFDTLGRDMRDECNGKKGDRLRMRKGLICRYESQLNGPTDSHYRCWIGLDMRTGNSVHTVSC